jgi:hypothetical protein
MQRLPSRPSPAHCNGRLQRALPATAAVFAYARFRKRPPVAAAALSAMCFLFAPSERAAAPAGPHARALRWSALATARTPPARQEPARNGSATRVTLRATNPRRAKTTGPGRNRLRVTRNRFSSARSNPGCLQPGLTISFTLLAQPPPFHLPLAIAFLSNRAVFFPDVGFGCSTPVFCGASLLGNAS